ncbi:alpha/beta hydrolase [Limosilactobacillus sp.]|uniref:alpha/beta hydrolase n=1 Tax=Limosilactobacillus sp. TaxID=2773925 RepID=UPI00345EB675
MKLFGNIDKAAAKRIALLIIVLLIVIVIPLYFCMRSNTHTMVQRHNSRVSPLIMIPGSSAGQNRFDRLVAKLNAGPSGSKKHSYMKMKVYNSGKITYTGSIASGDNEPIVVIAFQNNHDGYSNIKKQARMFNKAFRVLSEQYKFNNFKAFGHSNGGLVWTYWLEHYYSSYSDQIRIKRLMTLGTPYNFAETSAGNKTQMFNDFLKYKKRLPENLVVYSLMGTETYDSDGLVPEGSVEAGKYIYQKQVSHFTTMTVTGKDAEHSSLPQNNQVVQVIQENLLDSQQPANHVRNRKRTNKKNINNNQSTVENNNDD